MNKQIEVVNSISYKPWVYITTEVKDHVVVRITYETRCAYSKSSVTRNTIFGKLLPHWNEKQVIDYVYHLLQFFEQHELDEWFEVDGVKVNDPHSRDPDVNHSQEFHDYAASMVDLNT